MEVLQIATPCGAMTSVEIDPDKYEITKAFAMGAAFGCRLCGPNCPLWKIANLTENPKDLSRLLAIRGEME